jgi:hypothetical protein
MGQRNPPAHSPELRALPEHLDAERVTIRRGDVHVVRWRR